MKIRKTITILMGLFLPFYMNFLNASSQEPPLALQQWITEQMQQYNIVGASLVVIKNYHIEWAKGFGYRDKAKKSLVTVNTLFNAASISKPVTALAALEIFSTKHLSLDSSVNDYLTSWHIPDNSYTHNHPVTMRLLLQHSAGITGWREKGYPQGTPLPTLTEVLNGAYPANTPPITIISQPGSQYLYSPAGYAIIQQCLMDIDHLPFSTIMVKLIFIPLNMTHSVFTPPLPAAYQDKIAFPYLPDGTPMPNGPYMFIDAAAGGLWTTPTDLARFMIAIEKTLAGQDQTPLNSQLINIMLTSGVGHNMGAGMGVNFNKYGQNINRTGYYFGHSGYNSGYLSFMLGSKTQGNGIIIMINSAPYMTETNVPEYNFLLAVIKKVADMENWQ